MTEFANIDPYDIKAAVKTTTLNALDADPLYASAVDVAVDVQALYSWCRECPRYEALWDQCQRAASSIALNVAQGYGKLRGFLMNDLLCARAEAFELYAGLSILPKDVSAPIKVKLKGVIGLLDSRIASVPEKSDRASWR